MSCQAWRNLLTWPRTLKRRALKGRLFRATIMERRRRLSHHWKAKSLMSPASCAMLRERCPTAAPPARGFLGYDGLLRTAEAGQRSPDIRRKGRMFALVSVAE